MASGFSIVAAHESEENSNHIVVLPRSIKIVRLQVMQEQINSGQNSVAATSNRRLKTNLNFPTLPRPV